MFAEFALPDRASSRHIVTPEPQVFNGPDLREGYIVLQQAFERKLN